jgi:hypothetical protein
MFGASHNRGLVELPNNSQAIRPHRDCLKLHASLPRIHLSDGFADQVKRNLINPHPETLIDSALVGYSHFGDVVSSTNIPFVAGLLDNLKDNSA